ncbi:hypothetical protein SLS56_005812 [Neofusicoccum ribis]|uniref:Glycosyltransferase family 28 N-terminal domain-containing protein n=1 Tax=Neofusicoccum ribis TaxID=45134 RepID=A0ABR3STG8_9PEZI
MRLPLSRFGLPLAAASLAAGQNQTDYCNSTYQSAFEAALALESASWVSQNVTLDPFYSLPSNISGEPGTLLRWQDIPASQLSSNWTIPGGLSLSRFLYLSEDVDGSLLPASAFVLLPYSPVTAADGGNETNTTTPFNTVVFTHGTAGRIRNCAPSNHRGLYYEWEGPLALASAGFAVVAPDYAGLGTEIRQGFMATYQSYPGLNHDVSFQASQPNYVRWIRERFEGVEVAEGCVKETVRPVTDRHSRLLTCPIDSTNFLPILPRNLRILSHRVNSYRKTSFLKEEDDGRIDVDANSKLVRTLSRIYKPLEQLPETPPPPYQDVTSEPGKWNIRLNIVIQIVGSRGDVQPFIALGNELKQFGHRIRIATHNVFEQFVRESGLEFYPIGGDPSELMAYMVKNPGLIPSMKSLRAGEINRKRAMVEQMLDGCWKSCLEPDTLTGHPFVADAIIANPPSFAHVHCAQALGVPVHLVFTMPWSKTTAFSHPLANLKNADRDTGTINYVSYGVVNWLTWQGLGDVINKWRKGLDLEEVPMSEGPDLADSLKIPFTYCWSPALVPKPRDWPSYIDVCGFFFREPPQYTPPPELDEFLKAGPPPVYIGFGSIVLDDPAGMTATVLQAVKATGIRAIISKGWSKLGGAHEGTVHFVGDCPHEWLFQRVAAVVHHGGAGTTACGLRYAKPTFIVPFFGEEALLKTRLTPDSQPFWGDMVAARGAGPKPIPHKELSASNLAEAIRFCLTPEAASAASAIAESMRAENGVRAAAESIHKHLPLDRLRCDILPDQPAAWSFGKGGRKVKLSKVAAEIVLSNTPARRKRVEPYESKPIAIEVRRWDPVTGGASAVLGTTADLTQSVTGAFYKPVEEYRKHHRELADGAHHGRGDTASGGSANSEASLKNKEISLAGKMGSASAKSLGQVAPIATKGMLVDIPLALTEGLRNLPRAYGEEVRDHGKVTDWKSGAAVAGKTFAWGMAEGISDIGVKPYQGAKKEGAVGAMKGIGKGMVSMGAKAGAAMFGLMAYPSAGVAKSLSSMTRTRTRKKIAEARHAEGRWLIEQGELQSVSDAAVMGAFEVLGQ